ncbi:hypothetical protein [Agaribacterium sp. ZY112]|uniref:hypothetical protein n=1 Tax=Agaribacterium sp. ZY112 TaxID=3233574 RepID=UPI003525E01A
MSSNLKPALEANQKDAYIFSLEALAKEVSYKLGKNLDDFDFSDAKSLGAYYVPIQDSRVVLEIMKELGITGEIVMKNVRGKSYVILKGTPGNRNLLRGTRYLSNNPQIIKMAIGTKAVSRSIVKGSLVTLIITVPLSIADVCLKDDFTMGRLFGTLATDITKVLISSGAASLAALAVGAVTTVAAGPLIAAIFVGVAVGVALESLDQRFGITDKLVKAIEEEMNTLYERTIGEFKREIRRVEALMDYQSRNGLPVGEGIFY